MIKNAKKIVPDVKSLAQCQEFCLNEKAFVCLSISYRDRSVEKDCHLNDVKKEKAGANWSDNDRSFDYYEYEKLGGNHTRLFK